MHLGFGVGRAADSVGPTIAQFCVTHEIDCKPVTVDESMLGIMFAILGAILGGLLFAPAVRWARCFAVLHSSTSPSSSPFNPTNDTVEEHERNVPGVGSVTISPSKVCKGLSLLQVEGHSNIFYCVL